MPIVFATNFAADRNESGFLDYQSVLDRYPGSIPWSNSPAANNSGWYMGSRTISSASGPNVLRLPIPEFNGNRIEIILGLAGGALPSANWNGTWNIFGITFQYIGGTINMAGVPTVSDLSTANVIHLICELDVDTDRWYLSLFTDDGVKVQSRIVKPEFSSEIVSTYSQAQQFPGPIQRFLDYVVVAYDTPPGTRITNVNFQDLAVSATETGSFQFSDQGFDADVDKNTGTVADPHVYSSIDGDSISYVAQSVPAGSLVTVHTAGQTESSVQYLDVQTSEELKTYRLLGQRALPSVVGGSVDMTLRTPTLPIVSQLDFNNVPLGSLYSLGGIDRIANNQWQINPHAAYSRPSVEEGGPFSPGEKCLRLNNSSGFLSLPVEQVPGLGPRPFTVEIWARRADSEADATLVALFGKNGGSNDTASDFGIRSSATDLYITIRGSSSPVQLPTRWVPGTWGLFGMTHDGTGRISVYFNGQYVGVRVTTLANLISTYPLLFGSWTTSTSGVSTVTQFSYFRVIDGVDLYEEQSYTVPTEPWPNP